MKYTESKIFVAIAALFLFVGLSASAVGDVRPARKVANYSRTNATRIVEQRHLPNGLTVNIVETADGVRFKQTARPEKGEFAVKHSSNQVKALTVDKRPLLNWSESFEGWQKGNPDSLWLPQGWERKMNNESYAKNYSRTWHPFYRQNVYYYPEVPHGNTYMMIIFDATSSQNEWLYTPEFVPVEGDQFTFTFQTTPFYFYDYSYWDNSAKEFTQREAVCNFQVYGRVKDPDSGEWGEWGLFYDFVEDDCSLLTGKEMWTSSSNDGCTTFIKHFPMEGAEGATMQFAFRYYGKDGQTMFLDDIQLGKPFLTAEYHEPLYTMRLGMTQDWETPASALYCPDGVDIKWYNMSCSEATSFEWKYEDASHALAVSNDTNLVLNYPYTAETVGSIRNLNVYSTPVLTAKADGFMDEVYEGPTPNIKIGGKTYVKKGGEEYHTGAATYDVNDGATMLYDDNEVPIAGVMYDQELGLIESDFWANWYYTFWGHEEDAFTYQVLGFYNAFPTPEKAYKLRGLWVHGIGEINPSLANLTVSVHRLTDADAIDEDPIAIGYLNNEDIQYYGKATELGLGQYDHLTLPFVFSDPVEINEFVYIRINGLTDGGVNYFAPLQNSKPNEENSYGYIRLQYTSKATNETTTAMQPLYYVVMSDENDQFVYPYGSFYMTLDMAYGDCEDWGHIDIETNRPGGIDSDAPKLDLSAGHIQYHKKGETLYDRTVKSAFYDGGNADYTDLYVCVGALEVGQDPNLTNHIYIHMKNEDFNDVLATGKTLTFGEDCVADVAFYDIAYRTYAYVARKGILKLSKTASGYDVYVEAYDPDAGTTFGCDYTSATTQKWMDYNVEPQMPNEWKVGTDGKDVHAITRVVLNNTKPEMNVFRIESDEQPIVIYSHSEFFDGKYHGFSGVHNDFLGDTLSIVVRGRAYNYDTTTRPNAEASLLANYDATKVYGLALGGNVLATVDETNKTVHLEFTVYAPVSENTIENGESTRHNITGYYDGPLTLDLTNGIQTITTGENEGQRYNIYGQRVSESYRGIVVVGGKKVLVK